MPRAVVLRAGACPCEGAPGARACSSNPTATAGKACGKSPSRKTECSSGLWHTTPSPPALSRCSPRPAEPRAQTSRKGENFAALFSASVLKSGAYVRPSCSSGEVAEWSNAPDSKSGVLAREPGVRIPPSPPFISPENERGPRDLPCAAHPARDSNPCRGFDGVSAANGDGATRSVEGAARAQRANPSLSAI